MDRSYHSINIILVLCLVARIYSRLMYFLPRCSSEARNLELAIFHSAPTIDNLSSCQIEFVSLLRRSGDIGTVPSEGDHLST